MSDPNGPPPPAAELQRLAALRQRATARLPAAAGGDAAAAAADALVVLHAMASAPSTAAKALALLHELQVYQVELDLQAQELRDDRAVLEAALRRQGQRYDHLPVGCVTLDTGLVVRELNRGAARMLGVDPDHALGLPLAGLVAADSLQGLRSAVAAVDGGRQPAACRLVLGAPPGRGVAVHVAADPAGPGYLVTLAPDFDGERPAAA